jgi:hypothetical protein
MASKRELSFWRGKVRQGSLTVTLRSHPKRAIRFFGAHAVYGEQEHTLRQVLHAQVIASTSDRELLANCDNFLPGPNHALASLSPEEWQQWKADWLVKTKTEARQVLERHLAIPARAENA